MAKTLLHIIPIKHIQRLKHKIKHQISIICKCDVARQTVGKVGDKKGILEEILSFVWN